MRVVGMQFSLSIFIKFSPTTTTILLNIIILIS
jgi:hypothetical protein